MSSSALPPFDFIIRTMKDAGLTPSEMIQLLPIGRATFYNWKRGQPIADLLRYRLTIARCKIIAMATVQERLPLSEDVPKSMRLATVEKILLDVRRS